MNLIQFIRIIWARRLVILLSTLFCALAGIVVVQVVAPKYVAQSRIMLDVVKPDPVTGQVMATAFLRAYTKTQIELMKDEQVARMVVQDLGWENDPAWQKRYASRKSTDDRSFSRWAAQQVMDGADARLIEGSNILEISYTSESPPRAKQVADALRKAYLALTLQSRRAAARRNADWYDGQAAKARQMLVQAEATKSQYERETGIVLQDDRTDIDSTRLAALAQQAGGPVFTPMVQDNGVAAMQLAQLDADIATASKTLGVNHPQLIEMRKRRELLAQQAAQEKRAAQTAAGAGAAAAQATAGLMEAQKAKVMAQREKVEKLRLMQDEISLRRDQYNRAVARSAQLRQEADVVESGVTELGGAVTPQFPVFPKKPLIVGGATAAGAGLGLFVALLLELFGRRIRSADDLQQAADAPVLAILQSPLGETRSRIGAPIKQLLGGRGRRIKLSRA